MVNLYLFMSKVKDTHIKLNTPWFNLLEKTVLVERNDTEVQEKYYSISADDYVCVLAVTKEGDFILVQQYRPAVEDVTMELPAGHVENGETPLEAAKRELYEETGYLTEDIKFLGCLDPDTGRLSNKLWCFFADNVIFDTKSEAETGVSRIVVSKKQLNDLIVQGKFKHALHIAVFFLAVQNNLLSINKF